MGNIVSNLDKPLKSKDFPSQIVATTFVAYFLLFVLRWTKTQEFGSCYPETLEVPIRDRVQLRILELGDEAGEKQKKRNVIH